MAYLAVGVGSALGGVGRFWIAGMIGQRFGEVFPWGTIFVNGSGSFVIGALAAWMAADGAGSAKLSPLGAQFFMVGVCGGYTTFSAFSLQTLKLLQTGAYGQAGANVALSLLACLVAVWLGFLAGQWVNR